MRVYAWGICVVILGKEDDMKINTDLLKQIRKERGLTQQQLADRIGIHDRLLQRYESGNRNPKYERVCEIANALEIHPYILLGDTSSPSVLRVKEILCNWILGMNMMELFEFAGVLEDSDLEQYRNVANKYLYTCSRCKTDNPECPLEATDNTDVCFECFCKHYGVFDKGDE